MNNGPSSAPSNDLPDLSAINLSLAAGVPRTLEELIDLYAEKLAKRLKASFESMQSGFTAHNDDIGYLPIRLHPDFGLVEDDDEQTMEAFLVDVVRRIDDANSISAAYYVDKDEAHRNLVLRFELDGNYYYLCNINPKGDKNDLFLATSAKERKDSEDVIDSLDYESDTGTEVAQLRNAKRKIDERDATILKWKMISAGVGLALIAALGHDLFEGRGSSSLEEGEGSGEVADDVVPVEASADDFDPTVIVGQDGNVIN
jgi:hypothetical protein